METNAGYAVVATNVTEDTFDFVTNSIPTTAPQTFIRLIIESDRQDHFSDTNALIKFCFNSTCGLIFIVLPRFYALINDELVCGCHSIRILPPMESEPPWNPSLNMAKFKSSRCMRFGDCRQSTPLHKSQY
jgi:hypothetical protein